MPAAREDYVIRMIRDVVQALARLAGLRREGQFATARDELARAKRAIAGPAGAMLDQVDARTAVHLLGDPRRALAYAQLLIEEAELERASGDTALADRIRTRALAIARELAALPNPPQVVDALLK